MDDWESTSSFVFLVLELFRGLLRSNM